MGTGNIPKVCSKCMHYYRDEFGLECCRTAGYIKDICDFTDEGCQFWNAHECVERNYDCWACMSVTSGRAYCVARESDECPLDYEEVL